MSSVLLVVDPHFSAVDDAGYDPVCVCVVCVRVYAHYIMSPRRGTPVRNKKLTKETPFWREESGHLVGRARFLQRQVCGLWTLQTI